MGAYEGALSTRVQQESVGVRPGPELPVTVVEVVVESLRDLVTPAVVVVVLLLPQNGPTPLLHVWGGALSQVGQLVVSGAHTFVLLGF